MDAEEREHIPISIYYLPSRHKLLPFHLFSMDESNNQMELLVRANNLLPFEKREEIWENEDIFPLYILKEQKITFEEFTGVKLGPPLNKKKAHLQIRKTFGEMLERDEFLPWIVAVAQYISEFSSSLSSEVSLCKLLSQKLLFEDTFTNRIVAMGVTFSIFANRLDPVEQSDLINATYFHHLGITQLPLHLQIIPREKFTPYQRYLYQKHPLLTLQLLEQTPLVIGDRAKEIIRNHHELADGTGYPKQKLEGDYPPSTLLLGFSSHVMEYSSGLINGNILSVAKTMKHIKNKVRVTGLELSFGSEIEKILSRIF